MPWKDPEVRNARRRERYATDPEFRAKQLAATARWQAANPERARARQREWQQANRERENERQARARAADPEAHRERTRRSRAKNIEAYRERDRERKRELRANGDPKIRQHIRADRARRRGAPMDAEAKEYAAVLMSDPCSYCGGSAATIDHIDPLKLGGDSSWDNLTPACVSCNSRKNDKPLLLALLP